MSSDYCRDPQCRQPVESEGWAPWCSLGCAHRWVWRRQGVDWIEPESAARASARKVG